MAWAFVQAPTAVRNSSVSSQAIVFGSAVSSNNRIIIAIGWRAVFSGTVTISSVTDDLGNTYSLDKHQTIVEDGTHFAYGAVYSAPVTSTGTPTVTVAWSASCTQVELAAAEYSGLATSSPVDVSSSGSGNGTTSVASGSTANTTAANELVFAAVCAPNQGGNSSFSASGYTERASNFGVFEAFIWIADKDSGSSGTSQSMSGTLGDASVHADFAIVYKLAGGGAASPFTPGSWPTVERHRTSSALRTWSNNLLTTTLAPVTADPFRPGAWPNPQTRPFPAALRSWESHYQLDDNVPFVPKSWDLPLLRTLATAQRFWSNNLLGSTLAPVLAAPFPSGDWTMPLPKVPGRDLRTWIGARVRGLLAEVPPKTQAAGPNVPGRVHSRALYTWGNNLLESTLAPPPATGVFRRSINARVGSRSQE